MTQRMHSTLRERVMQLTGARTHGASASVDSSATSAEADWDTPAGLRKGRKSWRRRLSLGVLRDASPEPGGAIKDSAKEDPKDVRAAAVSEDGSRGPHVDVGTTAALPMADETRSQSIYLTTKSGDALEIHDQVQLYAPNNLLAHPLVSPALSFLGGLPPLLVIASDAEVLRDEVIYA